MENKSVSTNDMQIETGELNDQFETIRSDIEMGITEGWLAQKNMMYINDIEDMCMLQERFKSAGDGLDTIIYYVQQGESEAPTEENTRELMSKLGELQSELHNRSEYYS